jgi:hypothetical protein
MVDHLGKSSGGARRSEAVPGHRFIQAIDLRAFDDVSLDP